MNHERLRIYEYVHIPIWLIKDSCWAMQFKTLGVLMITPTLALALMICIRTRHTYLDLLPNIAIFLWISANSIWMCDEFFELGKKEYCYIPFILGLIIISIWLFFYFPAMWKKKEVKNVGK